ncbi:MAG: ABC transporter ATP-binding protein [Atopobiaceae bacterium]|jgi:NitT/TauT family transport system ATP-binding protein
MALVLSNITKCFPAPDGEGVTVALEQVDLTVQSGEFISLVGPSGCGKSTLLRIIAGLTTPTTGEAVLDGTTIKDAGPDRCFAFQRPTLFPWLTVEENVAFGLRMQGEQNTRRQEIRDLIDLAGLSEFRTNYPHQLSGGMAQRVELVRAMVMEPKVLLLDEPLGALDAFTRMTMQDEILSLWRRVGCTAIMVTHDVDEAIYMGQSVVVMAPHPGRVIERFEVGMDYPRDRTSERFFSLRSEVLSRLDYASEKKAVEA